MERKTHILDNTKRKVGDFLQKNIHAGGHLDIVSAYFSIHAYDALQNQLESVQNLRFLFGAPASAASPDPEEKPAEQYTLTDEGISLANLLQQSELAKSCADWISKESVEIRTIKQANFLHGKMYHCRPSATPGTSKTSITRQTAIIGSSNFTLRGLGLSAHPNIELNLQADDTACTELGSWFEQIWKSDKVRDAKPEVLAALENLYKDQPPADIYYKSLLNIFAEQLKSRNIREELINATHLKDTAIWKALHKFQEHGAIGAINRLEDHGGCIIADSVGLGKTYEALAIIKFYELRAKRVLVLCPKRLAENWLLYQGAQNISGNPFLRDNFCYTVLAHTDLTRKSGKAGMIENLADFDWGNFDLIVIDESHNFRNDSSGSRDPKTGEQRPSRYDNLLNKIIKKADHANAKVLMLSATPVNTSLIDLRNQVHLMTGKNDNAFGETLGIPNITTLFNIAQKQVAQCDNNKEQILRTLGGDFTRLLDSISIARSRKHIQQHYRKFIEQNGDFPKHNPPENIYAHTDTKSEFSYEKMNHRIGKFSLAIYNPSKFVKDETTLEKDKQTTKMDPRRRENYLIHMMRVNFMKRLESSVDSFRLTLERTIAKIDTQIERIDTYTDKQTNSRDNHISTEEQIQDINEEEDWNVGQGTHSYHLNELDTTRWKTALVSDRENLNDALQQAIAITPERDNKLLELRARLLQKITHPTTDNNGNPNRKALIFTSYADTAKYLYDNLADLGNLSKENIHIARVAGGDSNASSSSHTKFIDILNAFSPRARNSDKEKTDILLGGKEEIDILIGTDCIAEGQNLQDCDTVINYDIHWNPIRLVQRFGRIDRLGSENKTVQMINFWPTEDLDSYLNLEDRVIKRMVISDITASGSGNPLEVSEESETYGADTDTETETSGQQELDFRGKQLRKLSTETLNAEDMEGGLNMSDLTLDDFLAELLIYLENNRDRLEAIPDGVYAVADSKTAHTLFSPDTAQPGIIFCLKQKNAGDKRANNNAIHPYYLLYVRDNGDVHFNYFNAKETMSLFGALSRKHTEPIQHLCNQVNIKTDHKKYNELAIKAVQAAKEGHNKGDLEALRQNKIATREKQKAQSADDFELITWLIIK